MVKFRRRRRSPREVMEDDLYWSLWLHHKGYPKDAEKLIIKIMRRLT